MWRASLIYVLFLGPGHVWICNYFGIVFTFKVKDCLVLFNVFILHYLFGAVPLQWRYVSGGVMKTFWGDVNGGNLRGTSLQILNFCVFVLKFHLSKLTWITPFIFSLYCIRTPLWFYSRKVPHFHPGWCYDSFLPGVKTFTVPRIQWDSPFNQDSVTFPPSSSFRYIYKKRITVYLKNLFKCNVIILFWLGGNHTCTHDNLDMHLNTEKK